MSRSRDKKMARYLAGEMSMNEEIAFMSESGKSLEQMSELRNMEKHWKYYDQNPSRENWNSGEAWNRFHQKLESEGLLEDQAVKPGRDTLSPLLRIAASIVLVLAIGIPALYFGVIRDNAEENTRHHLAEEGVATVDLPDGSRVYLNKGAEIAYSKAFKNQRAVKLTGEAFFEVMSDPQNPFTVRSGEMVVSVLGTSFNVKQRDRSSNVEVYVKTGLVKVSLEKSDQFIYLEPEQFGVVENRNLSSSVQEDPNYISWKTKDFKFVNSALLEVLQELEESYHVDIHTGDVDISDMRITTSYSGQSINAILETIGTAFEMSISHRDNSYFLTK
ncbi:MAG: FecR domain-containing protein [Bacteroidales bacterium]|nr:FecR domain-containing protein [Bacteroidales bacterium]